MTDNNPEGGLERVVQQALKPERLLAVYKHAFPYAKAETLNGKEAGWYRFRPNSSYVREFYNLIYHDALLPLSTIPFESLLKFDLAQLLPGEDAEDYPEQCLGMITILDQQRILTAGYGCRYTSAFFDPICEKLGRQLISLPDDKRPDGKVAWLSRGYSLEDWLIRTLWFWGPLVHSDTFIVKDRQIVKDYLHHVRSEVELYTGRKDPFAATEVTDDRDLTAFTRIEKEGPPQTSYFNSSQVATVPDYAFWWIRILNSHFAITDSCGRYPFWVRSKGEELNDQDQAYMDIADGYRFENLSTAEVREIREDFLAGRWKPLAVNPAFEP